MDPNHGPARLDMPRMDDYNLRREIENHPQDLGSELSYLVPMTAYASMDADTRKHLLDWIATMIAPANEVYCANSYSIKHDAEAAIGCYITNDEFKGAMVASGHAPTHDTLRDVNCPDVLFRDALLSTTILLQEAVDILDKHAAFGGMLEDLHERAIARQEDRRTPLSTLIEMARVNELQPD